tara:strand:- start:13 stop:300 length:288 start_codon:yes stop_codon:yes gene_type:complete
MKRLNDWSHFFLANANRPLDLLPCCTALQQIELRFSVDNRKKSDNKKQPGTFFLFFYIVVLVLIVSLDPRGMRHDEDNFGEKPESQKLETVCHPL